MVSREYAVPHVSHSHTPPVARRLLYPEPPPIPPPPDQYYPASDTWKVSASQITVSANSAESRRLSGSKLRVHVK